MPLVFRSKLIELRHRFDIIVYGEFVPLLEEDPDVYAYARVLDGKRLTVLLNWTERTVSCPMTTEGLGEELISNYPTHQPGRLQPYEAVVVAADREP